MKESCLLSPYYKLQRCCESKLNKTNVNFDFKTKPRTKHQILTSSSDTESGNSSDTEYIIAGNMHKKQAYLKKTDKPPSAKQKVKIGAFVKVPNFAVGLAQLY